jgi:hypothetical protein
MTSHNVGVGLFVTQGVNPAKHVDVKSEKNKVSCNKGSLLHHLG